MGWLDQLRATSPGGSGYDNAHVVEAGRAYARRYQVTNESGAEGSMVYTLDGYVGAEVGAWYPGKRGTVYDLAGRELSTFEIKDPNARDIGGMIALAFIAVVSAGAAYTALAAPSASLGGGYGIVGGATEPVASLSLSSGSVAAGGTAAAATAATTAATTTTAATISTVAGTVAKIAGAAASVLGLTQAGGSQPAPVTRAPGPQPLDQAGDLTRNPVALIAAAALAFFALKG